MRLKLGLETSVPSLHMGFTVAAVRARRPSRCAWGRSCSWAAARPRGGGDARRPGGPVRRSGAQDQGDGQEGDGGPARRRGLLPVQRGQRPRLRAGVDRDPAQRDGERGGPDRRPRRLPGQDERFYSFIPVRRTPHAAPAASRHAARRAHSSRRSRRHSPRRAPRMGAALPSAATQRIARLLASHRRRRRGRHGVIGNHIEFPNYEVDELVEIAKVMCRELEYELDRRHPRPHAYMEKRMTMPFFANARTVRRARAPDAPRRRRACDASAAPAPPAHAPPAPPRRSVTPSTWRACARRSASSTRRSSRPPATVTEQELPGTSRPPTSRRSRSRGRHHHGGLSPGVPLPHPGVRTS